MIQKEPRFFIKVAVRLPGSQREFFVGTNQFFVSQDITPLLNKWLFLVPVKGGIGGI